MNKIKALKVKIQAAQYSEESSFIEDPYHPHIDKEENDILIEPRVDPDQDKEKKVKFIEKIKKFDYQSFLGFQVTFLFNIYPVFLLFQYQLVKNVINIYAQETKIRLFWLTDFFLCSCINIVLLYAIFGFILSNFTSFQMEEINLQYYNWAMNGFVLSALYSGMVSFEQVYLQHNVDQESHFMQHANNFTRMIFNSQAHEFDYSTIISQQNYLVMGLGRFQSHYEKQQKRKKLNTTRLYRHQLLHDVHNIMREERVDQTLSFLTLSSDTPKIDQFDIDIFREIHDVQPKQETQKAQPLQCHNDAFVKVDFATNPLALLEEKLGFRGKHSIVNNFLIPHYLYTRKFLKPNLKMQAIFTVLGLNIKILMPTILLTPQFSIMIILYTIVFTGFYFHFISLLFSTFTNDDLKTKNYLLMALMKLISIEQYAENPDQQLLDVSCKISLLSWDQTRHIVLQLEEHRKFQHNFMYLFLVIYGKICLLTYLTCTAQAYTYVSLGGLCQQPILVYNMHIDIVLIAIVCVYRIQFGSQLNNTFAEIKDQLQKIQAVYEDMGTLFDFYFRPGVSALISNQLYYSLVNLIIGHSLHKYQHRLKKQTEVQDDPFNTPVEQLWTLQRENIDELLHTIKKMLKILTKDEIQYHDRFLGVYKSDVKEAWKIFSLLMVTFTPNVYNVAMKYISNMQ